MVGPTKVQPTCFLKSTAHQPSVHPNLGQPKFRFPLRDKKKIRRPHPAANVLRILDPNGHGLRRRPPRRPPRGAPSAIRLLAAAILRHFVLRPCTAPHGSCTRRTVPATGPGEPRGGGDHRVVARPHRGQRQARPRRSQIRGKETEPISLSSNPPPWTCRCSLELTPSLILCASAWAAVRHVGGNHR